LVRDALVGGVVEGWRGGVVEWWSGGVVAWSRRLEVGEAGGERGWR
jgi:hypothetical protein